METSVPEGDDIRAAAELVERGALPLQKCGACGEWVWFPRVACPSCFRNDLEWREASGNGCVAAVSTVHRTHHRDYEPHVPIVLVLVELDEGPRMVSSIVGDNRLKAAIGDRVRVAAEGRWSTLPQFELVRSR